VILFKEISTQQNNMQQHWRHGFSQK